MGEPMKRLCTVCARGGSKGVKNKNIRELLGKPLIAHTLIQAKASKLFDKIAVSSDSREILDVAKKWGADILVVRAAEMASDQSPKLAAIQHCVREAEKESGTAYDTLVDLDATAPFRSVEDIQTAVKLLEDKKVSSVITGALARKSPYFNLVEVDGAGRARLSKPGVSVGRRQDSPPCYDMNASIYAWRREALFKGQNLFHEDTLLYIMPEERSIEIDSELDFEIAELLGAKRGL